eukprot:COSAG02_NODE_42466_length_384_cov_0.905263_1_plen_109_part_10
MLIRRLDHVQNATVAMVKEAESTHCTVAEIKRLIAKGADVDGADEYSRTALIHAAVNNNVDVMQVLVDAGAHIDRVGERNYTALMRAVELGNLKAVRFLLDNGAYLKMK